MNFYQRLGVDEEASGKEIREAYKRAVRLTHPDKVEAGDGADKKNEAYLIIEAYKVLSDPQKKIEYDRDLKGTQ